MIVSDILYGDYQVEEVLAELIRCPELQRLKDIHMVGPSYLLQPLWNETRYEHSIGVMLLVRKMGGTLEEQIAGLLHDVSHTIFSHVIDLVLARAQEDYHEEIKQQYLADSSIPAILARFGYDYQAIVLDDSQWPILEQEAPLLCADRIDYTLREVQRYFGTDLKAIHDFLGKMEIVDNQIVLRDLAAGEWFIQQYYQVVLDFFYDPVNLYGYEIMSEILTYALEQKYLLQADLMRTETEALAKLEAVKDETLAGLFQRFYAPITLIETGPDSPYDLYQKKKTRLVDPLVWVAGQVHFTSEYSPEARQMNEQAKAQSERGRYLLIKAQQEDND